MTQNATLLPKNFFKFVVVVFLLFFVLFLFFCCFFPQPIEHVDIFFLAHSCPKFEDAMEPSSRELNILFHMWALQGM